MCNVGIVFVYNIIARPNHVAWRYMWHGIGYVQTLKFVLISFFWPLNAIWNTIRLQRCS